VVNYASYICSSRIEQKEGEFFLYIGNNKSVKHTCFVLSDWWAWQNASFVFSSAMIEPKE